MSCCVSLLLCSGIPQLLPQLCQAPEHTSLYWSILATSHALPWTHSAHSLLLPQDHDQHALSMVLLYSQYKRNA